jgi:hypothetical protein
MEDLGGVHSQAASCKLSFGPRWCHDMLSKNNVLQAPKNGKHPSKYAGNF